MARNVRGRRRAPAQHLLGRAAVTWMDFTWALAALAMVALSLLLTTLFAWASRVVLKLLTTTDFPLDF